MGGGSGVGGQLGQMAGGLKDPVMLQGDFRKVSGISSEIFRQIEAVENDHDPNTAAALEVIICMSAIREKDVSTRVNNGKHLSFVGCG